MNDETEGNGRVGENGLVTEEERILKIVERKILSIWTALLPVSGSALLYRCLQM